MIFNKKNLFIIVFFVFNFCAGQKQGNSFNLISKKDSVLVSYAHVFLDDILVTYSDEFGKFEINEEFKFLTIKHLSYKDKTISKEDLKQMEVILMEEKENQLDEVVISVRKSPKTIMLLPEKSVKESFMKGLDVVFPYEFINAVYIPNGLKKETCYITHIIFESRKGFDGPDSKYIPFKVNLMSVDTVNMLPKDKIFSEDLAVGKRENQRLLKIDVSNYGIEFPKEGIFVVVTLYEEAYYLSHGFTVQPGFGQTQIRKGSKFFELFWIPSRAVWDEPSYSKDRIQCRNFGIEVEY